MERPGSTVPETFARDAHIRRRADFQRVYDGGERVRTRLMTVIGLPNGGASARLGIAATRKLGGAVVRNRAKRLVREVFRRSHPDAGFDIVVIPRSEMLDADYRTLEADFRGAVRRVLRRRRPEP